MLNVIQPEDELQSQLPVDNLNINSIDEHKVRDFKSVNKLVFDKLKAAGLLNVRVLSDLDPDELVEIGLTKDRASKVISEAKDNLFCTFITAEEFHTIRSSRKKLKLFVESCDAILGGGFETQALTEIHGEFATGKTQICHQLCVTAQTPESEGGLDSTVIFIDTEHTFRPERLTTIAERFGRDPKQIRENIYHVRPETTDQLCHVMNRLSIEPFNMISGFTPKKPIRLLIVDSVIKNFRAEFLGRGTLADRQQRLSKFLSDCQAFALKFNAVVILINQVSANPDSMFGPTIRPTGGHVLGHSATYRISLKKKSGVGNRLMTIVDAPDLPPLSAQYSITHDGVSAVSDYDS